MFNDINLNALKYFYEVARSLNITKSAENLHISQPALTHAIQILEEALNTKLFIRTKRGVILTKSGEILFDYANKMFNELGSITRLIEDENSEDEYIYIGATTTNFLEPIKDDLAKFRENHKNVKIDIVLEGIDILEKRMKMGKLDILIKNDYEYMDNIKIIRSFEIEDRFVASRKHYQELADKVYSLEELLQYPFVLLSNITHGRRNFDNYLESLNIDFIPTYEFNSYSLCKELIRHGFGVGIGNPIHYETDDFIIINTNFNLPVRKFDICYNKLSKSDTLNSLIQYLKNL